ncbi:hypothetical protein TorRG33x02_240100 [Trema orientale]|uniref:Uncharacterized protein n=1 Tax=Trema orientale TaxID=63057 RepID=A0A2P5DWG8_TREOI|nr:hypothetical protein TorRG33x02_240100 [Trema orientale]
MAFSGRNTWCMAPHSYNSLGNLLQDHCSRYGKVFKSHLFSSPRVVSCDECLTISYFRMKAKRLNVVIQNPSMELGQASMRRRSQKAQKCGFPFVSITKSKPEFLNEIEIIAIHILHSWKDKRHVSSEEPRKKF